MHAVIDVSGALPYISQWSRAAGELRVGVSAPNERCLSDSELLGTEQLRSRVLRLKVVYARLTSFWIAGFSVSEVTCSDECVSYGSGA